jgi:hypothetical protein
MTPVPSRLRGEAVHYSWLREELLRVHADVDEDTLADTLEGISTLPDMLSAAVRAVLDDQALCGALKVRLGDLQDRLDRLEVRMQATRVVICEAMAESGLTKITEPHLTLSLRTGAPPLMVIDEEAIPERYWSPLPPKLERGVLKRALSDGKDIPGAVLGNGSQTISVRVR